MSDIMAQMQPDTAERLTVQLANKSASADKAMSNEDLPKIEGTPTPQEGKQNTSGEGKPNGT